MEEGKGDRQGEAIPAKFWSRRFELFSRFHEGVRLDAESWYSVTPEPIARRVAERMSAGLGASAGWLWLDAFCGAGGNAIQLAANDPHGVVVGVDIDPHKVELARHNARLYGVEGRIQFVIGDFTALAPRLRAHAVHLSPPWGGCHHRRVKEFDLTRMRVLGSQCDGMSLFDLALTISPSIAYYLPAHTWRAQLESLTWKHPSQRSELQEFMRRDGRRDRVHVIAAFFDAKPSSWLLAHSLGVSTRKVRMPSVPNHPAVM
ncbi:hypothetical protein AB1Y20_017384 [Prymnesium parvum]|uniref:Trimethylguanosine synthase n=1 Tax=Prymnesium parvum TaxID=97485 RepID=A0AB34JLG2_PRYPA